MATTAETIISIVQSSLDTNAEIPFVKMEELLANFDINSLGYNDLNTLLSDLESSFLLRETDEGVFVKCLNVPEKAIIPVKALVEPIDEKKCETVNRKLCGIIRKLAKASGDKDGKVALTDLGQERSSQGIEIPTHERLGAYLKRFPNIFDTDGSNVRIIGESMVNTSTTPVDKSVVPAAPPVQNKFISLYNIFDFASFDNYMLVKQMLSEQAAPEGWFVLPDSNERDPYCLIDYKLRLQFASAVNNQLLGQGNDIHLSIDSAWFNTGFVTFDGKIIKMYFKLNQFRDKLRWQTWCFERIAAE